MDKTKLKEYFKQGGSIKVIYPETHKTFNVIRKPEKVQTNAVKFEGGSWLFFNELNKDLIYTQGFKISDLCGGFIEYAYMNMDLIQKLLKTDGE